MQGTQGAGNTGYRAHRVQGTGYGVHRVHGTGNRVQDTQVTGIGLRAHKAEGIGRRLRIQGGQHSHSWEVHTVRHRGYSYTVRRVQDP